MTNNALFLDALSAHMGIPADSGVSRLTRSHLKTAMSMAFGSLAQERFEDLVDGLIRLVDRAREARLYARQRERAQMLAMVVPPVIGAA